jgi:glutathione peroxidase
MSKQTDTIYSFVATTAHGDTVGLDEFRGKVLLIVNVASHCGFTPQYEGLEALHRELADEGFSVLGFPCNQFGGQEPGSDEEIQQFCKLTYDVSFPVFAKVDVNGDDAAPLFVFLRDAAPGLLGSHAIKWNFTKFLIDRQGVPVKRYAPTTKPAKLSDDIRDLLAKQPPVEETGRRADETWYEGDNR